MAKSKKGERERPDAILMSPIGSPSALLDTRVVYCGLRRAQSNRDHVEQLAKLPDQCIDLIYIDPAPAERSRSTVQLQPPSLSVLGQQQCPIESHRYAAVDSNF